MVTDKLAFWLTDAGKLKLSMAHLTESATIELRNERDLLYKKRVNLRNGAQQTFDLLQVNEGTCRIKMTIGQEVTAKSIQIAQMQERTLQLT